MKSIIGQEYYFVHKGTWDKDYEWRIQKVKITGIKIDKNNKKYCEFSFGCTGYEYPISYLRKTLNGAKRLALKEINTEKEKQIKSILDIN